MYKENYKKMVKEIFQNNNNNKDTKQMYEKIKLITKNGNKTQFLKPEESFVISTEEWKKLQKNEINRDETKLITEPEKLS